MAGRKVHFAVADKLSTLNNFITKPDGEEQRQTDIGRDHTHPVNLILQEGFVVLTEGDGQTQNKGEDRADREKPERYGRSFRS